MARAKKQKSAPRRDGSSGNKTVASKGASKSSSKKSSKKRAEGDSEMDPPSQVAAASPQDASKMSSDEEEATDNESSPGSKNTKPSSIAVRVSTTDIDRVQVIQVVADFFFPQVKFVDKEEDLAYSTRKKSYCQHIISKMRLDDGIDECTWWRNARRWVYEAVCQQRSDRGQALKKAFFGKFTFDAARPPNYSSHISSVF